jgi:hypothetical protein
VYLAKIERLERIETFATAMTWLAASQEHKICFADYSGQNRDQL